MKRFAFLSQVWPDDETAPISGSSVQVYYVARELARRGHPTLVILSSHPGFTELNEGNLKVVYLPATGRTLLGMLNPRWLGRMRKILDDFGPDVIYQRGKLPETVAAADYATRNGATFVWLSNSDKSGEKWKFIKKRQAKGDRIIKRIPLLAEALYADWRIQAAMGKADVVIAQTQYQKDSLKRNFNMDANVLGSGHCIPPMPEKNNQRPMILWLANLTPMKQPQLFSLLAKNLSKENADFVMAGKAPDPEILNMVRREAKGADKFQYVGDVGLKSGNALFEKADLFISTSTNEGLPNTFIQAALHATPIVSLNSDPDGMIKRERIGAVCHNFEEIMDTVRFWIRNETERKLAGFRAYAYAHKAFNIKNIVDGLLNLIASKDMTT
jgi:glycosyltransferase involved in cell wall biosynthesis